MWRCLETKYQVPVRHAWGWEDDEEGDFEGGEAWEARMDALNTDYGAALTRSSDRSF